MTQPSKNLGIVTKADILQAPVLGVLVKLTVPTVLVFLLQAVVNLVEVYFVGGLGADAAAGVSLVFPVQMVMTAMASTGIGGGVASAIAQAIGAGQREQAQRIAGHAVVLALCAGAAITSANLLFGPRLFSLLAGASRTALPSAITYANTVFAGAIFVWLSSVLAAALRSSGNAKVPAMISLRSAVCTIVLSPALIQGWGPLPRLGIVGAGVGVVFYNALVSLWLIRYMRSSKASLSLPSIPMRVEVSQFSAILRVGGLSTLGTVQANLTTIFVTAAVALFGTDTLAGYGIASRMDYIMAPLVFSLGTAVLTIVAMNLGAGQHQRAMRAARIGALFAFLLTESVGLVLSVNGREWMGLFSNRSEVVEDGALYLRTIGPIYGLYGIALMAYFVGQGARQVSTPILAGTLRLAVAAAGAWIAVQWFHAAVGTIFWCVFGGHFIAGFTCLAFLVSMSGSRQIRWPSSPKAS